MCIRDRPQRTRSIFTAVAGQPLSFALSRRHDSNGRVHGVGSVGHPERSTCQVIIGIYQSFTITLEGRQYERHLAPGRATLVEASTGPR